VIVNMGSVSHGLMMFKICRLKKQANLECLQDPSLINIHNLKLVDI
jgi:hypothetical protein